MRHLKIKYGKSKYKFVDDKGRELGFATITLEQNKDTGRGVLSIFLTGASEGMELKLE